MARSIKITQFSIDLRSGENRAPHLGHVAFSDGISAWWHMEQDGRVSFSTTRFLRDETGKAFGSSKYFYESPKRSQIVLTHLNTM